VCEGVCTSRSAVSAPPPGDSCAECAPVDNTHQPLLNYTPSTPRDDSRTSAHRHQLIFSDAAEENRPGWRGGGGGTRRRRGRGDDGGGGGGRGPPRIAAVLFLLRHILAFAFRTANRGTGSRPLSM
jgi:hypothetical protein